MDLLIDILSGFFLFTGGFLVVTGTLGLFRFPDFFTRMHAVGITDTLGAGFILFGLILQSDGEWLIIAKLAFILVFTWFSSPTASHALAKAALHHQQKPLLGEDIHDK
jgi:multicomponent Na+:H+ antiporter subunit G